MCEMKYFDFHTEVVINVLDEKHDKLATLHLMCLPPIRLSPHALRILFKNILEVTNTNPSKFKCIHFSERRFISKIFVGERTETSFCVNDDNKKIICKILLIL